MGAWGHLALDNDSAADWVYDLEGREDLSLVEAALASLEEVGGEYLEQDLACAALAACEVLARLRGKPGHHNAYTQKVDAWVAQHRLLPSPALLQRAARAIERILGQESELKELWEESDDASAWRAGVEDLKLRATA